jgi:hypothetical protein
MPDRLGNLETWGQETWGQTGNLGTETWGQTGRFPDPGGEQLRTDLTPASVRFRTRFGYVH